MSESRGAASVTLDTINANALLPCLNEAFDWDTEGEPFMQEMADAFARAVTDALMAKGCISADRKDPEYVTYTLVLSLEAS